MHTVSSVRTTRIAGLLLGLTLSSSLLLAVPAAVSARNSVEGQAMTSPREEKIRMSPGVRARVGESLREGDEFKQTRDEAKQRAQALREQMQGLHGEERLEVWKRLLTIHQEIFSARMSFYQRRLSAIAEKVSARIERLKSEGTDVSAAEAKLAEANATIQKASVQGTAAAALFEQLQDDADPTVEDRKRLFEAVRATHELYRTALQQLKETVQLLK